MRRGGNPVPTGRMLLGEDPVQLDAYGCRLMGLALEQAPYIQMAEAWGAGSTRLEEGDVVRLNEPSAAADYPAPSGAVAALTRTVQARSACSACYASLVRALHTSGVQGLPIAIGQGWRGIPFDGLGVGACCNYAKERSPGLPAPGRGHPARPLRPLLSPTGNAHLISLRSQVRFCVQAANPLQIRYLHRLLSPVQ